LSIKSVCQVARSWVAVRSFRTRVVVRFMIFTASARNILDTPSYSQSNGQYRCHKTARCFLRIVKSIKYLTRSPVCAAYQIYLAQDEATAGFYAFSGENPRCVAAKLSAVLKSLIMYPRPSTALLTSSKSFWKTFEL
jgi:hypothetical protein